MYKKISLLLILIIAFIAGFILLTFTEDKNVINNDSKKPNSTSILIYFSNQKKAGEQNYDCDVVFGVYRNVPTTSDLPTLALQELFKGPNTAEKEQGYSSFFNLSTKDIFIDLKIINRNAYINLKDMRSIIPNASSSCGSAQLLSQMETTIKQFGTIEKAFFAINGNPQTFYEWLQLDCPVEIENCDRKPFN